MSTVSPLLSSSSIDEQQLGLRAKSNQQRNVQLTDILLSDLRLMKVLREEQAKERGELVTVRAKLAKTRENSARVLRKLKPLQPSFSGSDT